VSLMLEMRLGANLWKVSRHCRGEKVDGVEFSKLKSRYPRMIPIRTALPFPGNHEVAKLIVESFTACIAEVGFSCTHFLIDRS